MKSSHKRHRLLTPLLSLLLVSVSLWAQQPPQDAIGRLKAGNERFISDHPSAKHYADERKATSEEQHPYAIVLACADSRESPEILFDESIGKLFVIRVAGNVIDPVILGSIEYAAEHLHVGTLLILGHESCGAVTAAIEGGGADHIKDLLTLIAPAVEKAKQAKRDQAGTVDQAVRENVLLQMQQAVAQSAVLAELVHEKKLEIVGGIYNLHTGKVEFLQPPG